MLGEEFKAQMGTIAKNLIKTIAGSVGCR